MLRLGAVIPLKWQINFNKFHLRLKCAQGAHPEEGHAHRAAPAAPGASASASASGCKLHKTVTC